jgi:AcrR family transcriptional regulator
VDEIARRAGVGAGTVYRHFPTKESLFEAIVLGRVQRLVDRARSLAASEPPGEAFFRFLDVWTAEAVAKRDLLDALAAEGFDARRVASVAGGELWAALGELLTGAQEAGAVRRDVALPDLLALLTGTSLALRRAGAAERADRLLAVIRDGLRAAPGH